MQKTALNRVFIRPERTADFAAISSVNRRAFGGATEAQLVKTLRLEGCLRHSLVAQWGQQIIGHAAIAEAHIQTAATNNEFASKSALSLVSLSVDPNFQSSGVGARLVNEAINTCMLAQETLLFVLGHRDYYPRFGFMPAQQFGLSWEEGDDHETFMVLPLKHGALNDITGEVCLVDRVLVSN